MRTRVLAIAAITGGVLTMAVPAASATTIVNGLTCNTWIANSQGWGQCTGSGSGKWILHVGCQLNPVVNTSTQYGAGKTSIGCWAFPGVNDVWITDH